MNANALNGQFLPLEKLSFGVGDRFAHQAKAQLEACVLAARRGARVVPVWNKSQREHLIVGSEPASTRAAADAAVQALHWEQPYHVDADHIRLATVDRFLPHADFYTIDVADTIGQPSSDAEVAGFVAAHPELIGQVDIPGLASPLRVARSEVEECAGKYLRAVREAGEVYRHIARHKPGQRFVTEVSMDETDTPQSPMALLLILAALGDEGVPAQTIAPKFTGRFNKGVDYVGDLSQFEKEFNAALAVLDFARRRYGLPPTLKLSVHSGSDKFSIYGIIRCALARFQAGLHLKTAGTTWLEEVIGLAEAGGSGLELAKVIYAEALAHVDELCAPYASVIEIDRSRLPSASAVHGWSSEQFVGALRHDQSNRLYNPHLRQLLHVGYKIAAKQGARYLEALRANEATIARNVTTNLFERHLKPLFL